MESDAAPEQQLRAIERAEAAVWVDYPPTAWWYPPLMGLWAGFMVVTFSVLDGTAATIGRLVSVLVTFAVIAAYRRIRGTWPTGKAPAEFTRPMWLFVLGATVVVLAAWGTHAWLGDWPAVAVAAVLSWLLVAWYEKAYAAAAAAVKERLA